MSPYVYSLRSLAVVSHLLSCLFSYVSQGPFGTLWWPLQANNFYTSLVLLWIDSERGLKGGVSQKHFKCLNFDLGSVAWGLECALMFVEALKSCRRFSTRIWNKGCRNIISNILNLIWGLLGEAWSACFFLSGCSCFGWLFNTFWNKECRKIVSICLILIWGVLGEAWRVHSFLDGVLKFGVVFEWDLKQGVSEIISKCLNLIWGVLSEAWSVHSFLLGLSSLIGEFWLGFETRSVVKWFRTFATRFWECWVRLWVHTQFHRGAYFLGVFWMRFETRSVTKWFRTFATRFGECWVRMWVRTYVCRGAFCFTFCWMRFKTRSVAKLFWIFEIDLGVLGEL